MKRSRRLATRGQTMVEFAISILMILTVIFASIEFDRALLVSSSLANAARAGVRYAIVHGGSRTGTGDPASGATNTTNVIKAVKYFAQLGLINTDELTINVQYPASTNVLTDPGNSPGSAVIVSVRYPYKPLTFIPMNLTLGSTSRGVIVF